MYEAGGIALNAVARHFGVHYLRMWHISKSEGWLQPSDVAEINRARELCRNGLYRRAMRYLNACVSGESEARDSAIVTEAARINAIISRRVAASECSRKQRGM